MSTGDTEEVPTAERQLVVYQEIPQEPVLETHLAQRYWRLGDTCPIKYSLDSGFEDLRCFYRNWHFFQYPAERDQAPCTCPWSAQVQGTGPAGQGTGNGTSGGRSS